MANYYVAPWGNDNNDGLSFDMPKRSIQGAADLLVNNIEIIYIIGLFNEVVSNTFGNRIVGIKYAILDGFALGSSFGPYSISNCKIRNYPYLEGSVVYISSNNSIKNVTNTNIYAKGFDHELIIISSDFIIYPRNSIGDNCTIYSLDVDNILTLNVFTVGIWVDGAINYIVSNISVDQTDIECKFKYSLFINCKFRFTGGGLGQDEVTYEYPSGANDDDKIQNLRDRMVIVYGGVSSDYMEGCKYYSGPDTDIFIDPSKENFYLVEGCIAAAMDFNGDPIGARPEAKVINFNSDYTSIVNLDSNGKVIDQSIDSSALGNVLDFGKVRRVESLEALGIRSIRNGVEMNSSINLGPQIAEGINVLADQKNYIVEGEPITLDDAGGTNYNVDERFLAIDEGGGAGLGFDSASNIGYVREIDIDKPQALRIKCSRSSSDLSSVAHVNGYITLDLFLPPIVNTDSNGEPTYGNLDAGFVGPGVPLFTRYIQDLPIVKSNQLPA